MQSDPFICDRSFEWCRSVTRKSVQELMLCCPEDVTRTKPCVNEPWSTFQGSMRYLLPWGTPAHSCILRRTLNCPRVPQDTLVYSGSSNYLCVLVSIVSRTKKCVHDENSVCSHCQIPICNECIHLLHRGEKIPKALANDNYISYQHEFIVKNKVTWLEATIACPIFTGLIVYYVEGTPNQRGHMMMETLANPQRAYSVRGNVFSFMLPWDTVMANLSRAFAAGDFSQWPLDQDTAATIVRLRMVRGHEALVRQFKELRVRL